MAHYILTRNGDQVTETCRTTWCDFAVTYRLTPGPTVRNAKRGHACPPAGSRALDLEKDTH